MAETAQLAQAFYSVQDGDEASYVLLFDSSGSVSDMDFRKALDAGFLFATAVIPDGQRNELAVAQFSSNFKIECDFTKDLSHLQNKIGGNVVNKMGSSTNTAGALNETTKLLKNREKKRKIAFLFTDGHPDSQQDCVQAAKDLRNAGIDLLVVGIGNLDEVKLEQISPPRKMQDGSSENTYFLLHEYDSLIAAISSDYLPPGYHPLGASQTTIPDSKVFLTFKQLVTPANLKIGFKLEISIHNQSRIVIPASAYLEIGFPVNQSTPPLFPALEYKLGKQIDSNSSSSVEVDLKISGNSKSFDGILSRLPPCVPVSLCSPDRKLYKSEVFGFQMRVGRFLAEISSYKFRGQDPKTAKANILILGPRGQGKSTLINRLIWLLLEERREFARAMKSVTHGTKENHVVRGTEIEDYGFQFIDTVGISHGFTYGAGQLKEILQGNLRISSFDGTKSKQVEQPGGLNASLQAINEASSLQTHAVVFVIHQAACLEYSFDKAKAEHLGQQLQILKDLGHSPLVAITHMDQTSEKEDMIAQRVSKLLDSPSKNLFFLSNVDEGLLEKAKVRTFENEKVLAKLLKRSLDMAESYN